MSASNRAAAGGTGRGLRALGPLLRETAREWSDDDCLRLGAALAYYTLFSLAPLLVIAIAIAALLYGEELASGELMRRLEEMTGAEAAEGVRRMIEGASRPRAGIAASLAGFAAMALGASGAFGQLQRALDDIFDAPRRRGGVRAQLRQRALAFSMIVLTGGVLVLSLATGTALAALGGFIAGLFPGAALLARLLDLATSLALTTLLFALLFRVLPNARPSWSAAWRGGAFTALLFAVGRWAIALYLGRSSAGSIYGAASSLVVLLVWIYYSSQILFFGAEFTHVLERRRAAPEAPAP
jgi:membrane protein